MADLQVALLYCIGEFGIVYRGILNPNDFPQSVAIKTLRGIQSDSLNQNPVNQNFKNFSPCQS